MKRRISSGVSCFSAVSPALHGRLSRDEANAERSCGSVFGQCLYGAGVGAACVCVAGSWCCDYAALRS